MNAINPIRPAMTCDVVPRDYPADPNRGTCFCGAVEIEVTGAPLEMGYCHCSSCRSYSGNPLSAFKLFQAEQVKVKRGAEFIGHFAKSEISDRQFCTKCGGHIMTGHPTMGFTDVQAEILPGIAFKPVVHLNYADTVLPMKDGLPKLRDFPSEVGGSGELIPE
jgi:hypothetical protein